MLEPFRHMPLGSNGWGLGSERTESGRGMLLSNTHFPGVGEKQWWESHLTIPGQIDVYGASLVGIAAVNMGFNEHLAWTHTVSNAPRFTAYSLPLEPGDATRYQYDGEWVDMEETTYTIQVLQDDGTMAGHNRPLYRSHYGPMLNAPVVGWQETVGFTFRDVNDNNLQMLPAWFAMIASSPGTRPRPCSETTSCSTPTTITG